MNSIVSDTGVTLTQMLIREFYWTGLAVNSIVSDTGVTLTQMLIRESVIGLV